MRVTMLEVTTPIQCQVSPKWGVQTRQSVVIKVRPNSANLFVSQKFLVFVYWFLALGDEERRNLGGGLVLSVVA